MNNKIMSFLFVGILIFFLIFSIFLPDKEISYSERRKLSSFPEISFDNIISGDFFTDLNDYLVEQFPLRDGFRKLKGIFASNVLNKKENNGVFIRNSKIYQSNSSINYKSIDHMINLINNIKNNYIKSNNIYYSIIPDKNYYLKDTDIPRLDYNELVNIFEQKIDNMKYIDIFDTLDLESYYNTDIHWRQEKLENTTNKILVEMGNQTTSLPNKEYKYSKFYGALYGQVASNLKPDELIYLSNDELDNIKIYNYEKKEYQKVYNSNNLSNIDSYDVFLSGATPLLIIENEKQNNGKELVLFRDSFGSSIAPLLISSYSKITIIDLRYIGSNLLNSIEEIKFNENQDVLFLYSVPIINNSFTLK